MSIIDIFKKLEISATTHQAEDFENWVFNERWDAYNEYRMNKKIIAENSIRALNLRLPNGTVKKRYFGKVSIPLNLVLDVWVTPEMKTALEEMGLSISIITYDNHQLERESCDPSTSVELLESYYKNIEISGKPNEAKEFQLILKYSHRDWIEGEETSEISIPIVFNPDPRTLWKDIPTSENIIFYKPDSDKNYILVKKNEKFGSRKDIVAASQRGRSHANEGKPRDDDFSLFHCEDSDWYIIAVADGAGSAKYSRQGSKIACETVVSYCKEKLNNAENFEEKILAYYNAENEEIARKSMANEIYNIVGNAAFLAHKKINQAAIDNNAQSKDFATTLMFAICKKLDFGWFVASYWVGDGAMCILNTEKKSFKMLGNPDEGEYSGQTRFLTMPEIFSDPATTMGRLKFSIEEDFTSLILMTDGVSDAMFNVTKDLFTYDEWAEFWEKLKEGFPDDDIPGVDFSDDNEDSKNQLLDWLSFWSPGNHDDRTIAILY